MNEMLAQIKMLAQASDGVIRTKEVEAIGISRPHLKKYVDTGQLERVRKGLYILKDCMIDEYSLLQIQSSMLIFSFGTALFLWGMSDRTPHEIDVTVPRGLNLLRLRRDNPKVKFHYVIKDYYNIGITETTSPQGRTVRLYDQERCICDIIRQKDQVDMQIYTQAIKTYFRSNPNVRKLLKYGKQFGIESEIRTYMEVLT